MIKLLDKLLDFLGSDTMFTIIVIWFISIFISIFIRAI